MPEKADIAFKYNIMCGELGSLLKEQVNFISYDFRINPMLLIDHDLIELGNVFAKLCFALKELDELSSDIMERYGYPASKSLDKES